MDSHNAYSPPNIAIIGGGIVGMILAAGLHRRSIPVAVYEAASSFRESGAGIGFNPAAKACMLMIDPAVLTALRLCGGVSVSGAALDEFHDYLRWVDGYSRDDDVALEQVELAPGGWQKLYLKADAGYKGIEGTRRDHFLDQLAELLPSDSIHFNKQLDTLNDPEDGSRITLTFADGTSATADAVIGCDGIRSKVREFIVAPGSAPCHPTYTHVCSYRALLPMTSAIEALGPATATVYHNHIGPGANVIHYPVASNTLVNVAIFLHDANEWPDVSSWTTRDASRSDLDVALQHWNPRIRKLIQLLPERLPMLAVFDMYDHPLARYDHGRVCVAGDAAHASSPHHGAGAGMGIEDALCLCTLLAEVSSTDQDDESAVAVKLAAALRTYDRVRRGRSQWLVNSSRRVCELQHNSDFGDASRRVRAETCFEEILDRTFKIWKFDPMAMVRDAAERYRGECSSWCLDHV
ncbi:hypothetical protein AC578_1517 [Pseudocercospora eumusae]|uniref:FAD-binding domain-containing protein n=1 Tax=Pseudocercospora eumusae TaxID=321146 RepID=A0A139GXS7_9PEZI|nr:hypothetical protein AC578_1517 [Pseudocercospora eumusae]